LSATKNLDYGGGVILSDRSIREQLAAGRIVIDPLDEACLQPSSIDVKVSNLFRVFRNHTASVIDVKKDMTSLTELVEIADGDAFMLHPGEFALGSTLERVGVPDDMVARVEGKSSLGRLGLLIHSTAGFIDAGFDGERGELAHHALPRQENWPSEFHDDDHARRQAIRQGCIWFKVSRATRANPESLFRKL